MRNEPTTPVDVTVVIAAYNRSKLITRALESVRNQVRTAKEIIVVDDASTDDTAAVASAWGTHHTFPVRVVKLAKNGGPAVARNTGIELARTAYIAFLDSDDEHVPTTLAKLVSALEKCPGAVLSFADATVVSPSEVEEHGLLAPHFDLERDAIQLQESDPVLYRFSDAKSKLLHGSLIPTSATCFKREAALRAGGMPESVRASEDWLFWIRLSQQGHFTFQLADLARHHRHETNLTRPSDTEFIARQSIKARLQLLHGEKGIALTREQRNIVEQLITEYLRIWRYNLSMLGIGAYIHGLQQFGADCPSLLRKMHPLSDIKSLLRATYYSFRGIVR
jgi:glycosyltransferase involved in cell wall biosynthesis